MAHRVLVVDDEQDIRNALKEVLTDEGYTVFTARNGKDALDVLSREGPPDLIVADILMPVMDGIELIEALRRDPGLSAIPVVVLSAASTSTPPEGTLVLRKPIGLDLLLAAVRQFCPG
jgi:CheY-like chemotaxis protein